MPNFRDGLTMTACLLVSLAISTLELLAGRVVPVPFDGSTVVEGTFCPTTASSPDAEVRGILAAGLKKAKIKSKPVNRRRKYFANKLATYLLLVVCEELRHFLTADRAPLGCPVWVSVLGVGLCSLSLMSSPATSSAQPRLDNSTVYIKFHMNMLQLG